MIARPNISRNEWITAERGAFDVGNFAPSCCPGGHRGLGRPEQEVLVLEERGLGVSDLLVARRSALRRLLRRRARLAVPVLEARGGVRDEARRAPDVAAAEARMFDPQQRMLLETVWEAFEDASLAPRTVRSVGMFVGASTSGYLSEALGRGVTVSGAEAPFAATAWSLAILSNRVSYFFDWSGPSMTIDTACSSTVVALDIAIAQLRAGQTQRAVVGGSSLLDVFLTKIIRGAGMTGHDSRSKTFDVRANGYGRGEGVLALVVERADRRRRTRPSSRPLLCRTATQTALRLRTAWRSRR